jgi:plastocyanin domain-containing protein
MPKDAYCDCNNAIIIPQYHLRIKLKIGDNIVRFTPKSAGEFGYTCWMGMIKSKILVTPNGQ